MKKRNFRWIVSALLCLLLVCCKSTKVNVTTDTIAGYNMMMNQFSGSFTELQFDSICVADGIERDLSKWHTFSFIDFEDGDSIFEYLWIKEYSANNEAIYIVTQDTVGYLITKRVVNSKLYD